MIIKQFLSNRYTILGYYILVSFFIFYAAKSFPLFDWDVFPYVGSAKNFEIQDKQTLHNFVYAEAKQAIPGDKLNILLGFALPEGYEMGVYGDKSYKETVYSSVYTYRTTVSSNPEAFYQQLPFYKIKLLYVALIYLLAELGIDIYMATYMISAISMVLGLWILFFTFKPYVHQYLLYSIPVFAMAFGLIGIASLTTPDGFAFLMVVIIVYLLTRGNWLIFIAAPIAVLARPDLLIFGFIILTYYLINKKSWRYFSIASIVSSLILYFGVNHYFGNYGWETLFYHTYFESLAFPADTNIELTIGQIFNVYFSNFMILIFNKTLLCYASIVILSLFVLSQNYRSYDYKQKPFGIMVYILIASFLYILIHYLLFPSLSTRFFIAQYLISAIILLYLISDSYSANRNSINN